MGQECKPRIEPTVGELGNHERRYHPWGSESQSDWQAKTWSVGEVVNEIRGLLLWANNGGILPAVKRSCIVGALLLCALLASGQDDSMTLDDMVQSADQWAKENLDDETLRALQDVDRDKVKQFLQDIEKRYHGEYVIDLASLRDTAKAVLPLLERYEETQPYAAWLNAQMDYLEAADQFRLIIPPPKVEPGQPLKPATNPPPAMEREVWVKKLADRPWPDGAKPYVSRLKP